MKTHLPLLAGLMLASTALAAEPDLKLWYTTPAKKWDEALPLGNGRLGAMVFGGVTNEHFQLNEDTLVSDYPGYRNLPLDVHKDFSTITNLIARREFAEADKLVTEKWLGRSWACYQPLGDLFFDFVHQGPPQNYTRELDLNNALCRVRYEADGVKFTREIFASHPDEVIVVRFTADKPGRLNFRVRLTSPHPVEIRADAAQLTMHGQLPGLALRRTLDWVEKKGDTYKYPELWNKAGKRLPNASQVLYNGRGLAFDARLTVRAQGGKVSAEKEAMIVAGADEVVVIYTAASSYNGFEQKPVDASRKAAAFLQAIAQPDYSELFARHTRDYRSLFDRVTLDLGESNKLPTDQRLKKPDPSLAALYFQFGRYLMIAGSRPGTQPLNLQGIWNHEVIPPWACQYTLNINAEMNYWPAEVCNLSECTEPLLRMIRELAVDGRWVAREMYGRRGWVAHHNTTIWRDAQPVDNAAQVSFWPMGSGWLCQHLFEHYRFTGDRGFLEKEAYPVMKDACLFYLDWLVDNGKGQLVTPVSTSPENTFSYTNATGAKVRASVSSGGTMDMGIIRDVFGNTLRAAEILDLDAEFRATLKTTLGKLLPYQIGERGQLQEWQEDFAESDVHHRHVSHLFALHPSAQITPRGTPQLAAAARKTLELRGDGGTGWSKAWKINFWARLEDGDHAQKMLHELLTQSTHPNLLDVCPPFQIDGNFGGTAGIAEVLLQSHEVEQNEAPILSLLPALPVAWPSGSVKGLRARGGFVVDIAWQEGKVTAYRIAAKEPSEVKVRVNGQVKTVAAEKL
ncbi:MAG: glycoside hydrolase N-terminal domain-containing protein [Verrucomicrobiota bacterium]